MFLHQRRGTWSQPRFYHDVEDGDRRAESILAIKHMVYVSFTVQEDGTEESSRFYAAAVAKDGSVILAGSRVVKLDTGGRRLWEVTLKLPPHFKELVLVIAQPSNLRWTRCCWTAPQ